MRDDGERVSPMSARRDGCTITMLNRDIGISNAPEKVRHRNAALSLVMVQ